MNGLLFSLPGTPVIYYGDELGMGDNVYLGDRDAVRTPMQWSPDRNAGLLRRQPAAALPADHHRPRVPLRDGQRRGPAAEPRARCCAWMRRIIALRHQHQVFGRGDIEFLLPENAKVLAFIRRHERRAACWWWPTCRASPRACTSTCHEHRGTVPVELFGGTEFAPIGEGGYHLTLGPYGFYWFALAAPAPRRAGHGRRGSDDLPVISVAEDWRQLFRGRAGPRPRCTGAGPASSSATAGTPGAGPHDPRSVELLDTVPVAAGRGRPGRVRRPGPRRVRRRRARDLRRAADGRRRRRGRADRSPTTRNAGVAWIDVAPAGRAPAAVRRHRRRRRSSTPPSHAVQAAAARSTRNGGRRAPHVDHARAAPDRSTATGQRPHRGPHLGRAEQHVGGVRQPGRDEDVPAGPGGGEPRPRDRPLPHRAGGFAHTAPLLGALEYQKGRGEPRTLGVLNGYVPNEGDAWHYTLDALGLFYESALQHAARRRARGPRLGRSVLDAATEPPPDVAADAIGPYLDSAEMLGRRTAELHAGAGRRRRRGLRARAVHHALPAVALPVDARPGAPDAAAGAPHRSTGSTTDAARPTPSTCSTTRPTCSPRFDARARPPHRRQPHPGPRRLPPRPGAARRTRLRDHRLRGRAVALADRAADQAGRRSPTWPAWCGRSSTRPRPGSATSTARGLVPPDQRRRARAPRGRVWPTWVTIAVPRRLPRPRPTATRSCPPTRADTPRAARPPTCSTRRCTRCATTSTTGPTGRRSRCAGVRLDAAEAGEP